MDTVPKQEFRVRELSTRSVTLFPTRAQVVRDIKNVVLKVSPSPPTPGRRLTRMMELTNLSVCLARRKRDHHPGP